MQVVSYRVQWNTVLQTGSIDLRLADRSVAVLKAQNPGHLILWVDLLKDECPVYYWKDADGEGLSSDWEEVANTSDGMMRPNVEGSQE